MSNQLLLKLEAKVNQALEVIEVLRIQLAEMEENNVVLKIENAEMQSRQLQWEQSLTALLQSLSNADLSKSNKGSSQSDKRQQVSHNERVEQDIEIYEEADETTA
jgi:FtsZ-binding cell division protein ZapB